MTDETTTQLTEPESIAIGHLMFNMPFAGGLNLRSTRRGLKQDQVLGVDDILADLTTLAAALRTSGDRLTAVEAELSQYRTDVAGLRRILGTV